MAKQKKKKLIYGKTYSRTYIAGAVVEQIVFKLPDTHSGGKPRKSSPSQAKRVRTAHDKSLPNKMARLANCNFSNNDYFITLTYNDAEHSKLAASAEKLRLSKMQMEFAGIADTHYLYEAARQDLTKWLRRVRYACDKAGIDLRYLGVTSDMDGESKNDVRVHHHLFLNAEAVDIARARWRSAGNGEDCNSVGFKATQLWAEQLDRLPLCKYMLEQTCHYTDERAYKASLNLVKPAVRTVQVKDGHLAAPPRWGSLLYSSEWIPGKSQYIRYWLPESEAAKSATAVK